MKKNKNKNKGGNNGSLSKRSENENKKSSQQKDQNGNTNQDTKVVKEFQNGSNEKIIEQAKMRSSANFEDEDDVMRGDEDSPRQVIPKATIQNIKLDKIQILEEVESQQLSSQNQDQPNELVLQEKQNYQLSSDNQQVQQQESSIDQNFLMENLQQIEEHDLKSNKQNYKTEEFKNDNYPKQNDNLNLIQQIDDKQNLKSERHAQNKRKNSMDNMDAENSFVNVQSPETSNYHASNQAEKRKQILSGIQNSKRSAIKSKIINMMEKKQFKMQPKAIPLILFNQNTQQFEITEEAKEIAKQIKGPIGVVSVVGMYRTGKSYLLNRVILNVQKGEGFGVGPSINPCTKGLWMWAQPLVGYTDQNEKINVIVIDTEGMGGLDEDNNHDMRIFSLALLLSSYFVYNSMGSIDENALAGLSFVTNITQHLSAKTQQKNKTDSNNSKIDINEFMPKFLWIVRDFSLQLVDDQENEINSQQYLERALMDYNIVGGVSGSTNFNGERSLRQNKEIDQKNEIKKSLRKHFQDRDCCTIVRPLVDENNLQNLENMNTSDLRAEFIEQVMILRKKILNGQRIKQINNCQMDGTIWIQMAQQYIDSINGGSVPSIESSWSYIQKQRAQIMFEQIKQKFEKGIQNDIQIPANEREFEQFLEFHSQKSINELQQNFKDDLEIINEYTNDLQQFLSTRLIELRNQNLNECRNLSQNTLAQLFQELNQRLLIDTTPNGIAQNMSGLEFYLQDIANIYEENVSEFQEKLLIFLETKNLFLGQLVHFVHQHLENQLDQTNKILNDLKDRNQNSIQETKDMYRIEKQTLESQLKEALINKAEISATLELLKDQYTQLKQQKEQEDQENQSLIKKMKEQNFKKSDDLKQNKEEFEEKMQEMNRKNIKIQSEYEKEKALFEQKVLFLEKSLEEKTLKEREYMNNWTNHKSELSNEIRQVSQKYENEMKNLNQTLDEEREKYHEIENQLSDIQSEYSLKTELWKDQELRYKQMIEQAQEHSKQLENASDALKSESLINLENKLKDKITEIDELQKKLSKYEEKANSVEEDLKTKLQQNLKETAIKEQKIEFLTIQLQETKDQLEDVNKQHQQMLEAMNNTQREEIQNKDSSRDYENFESPSKSQRLQKKIDELKLQLANLQEKLQEQELQLKLQDSESRKIQKDQLQKLTDLEKERNQLNDQVRKYEQQLGSNIEQIELKHKEEILRLEQEIEDKQSNFESDMKLIQTKSEESLAQLKYFYEHEKEKLEARLRDEREKAQKKIDQYQEEFDQKMRNEFQEKDEEMDQLRSDFTELQQRHNQQITQVQHELSMKQQLIDTLEKQIEESKQRLGQLENNRNQAFEKQLEFFEQSRQEYSTRIDKLQSENLEKDRLIAQIQHKLERSQDENQRKIRDLQESQESLQKQRDSLQDKLEITKKKFVELQDEAQQNQLVFGRDHALSQQSIEFLQRKIEEMQNMFDEKSHFYEQKLMTIRQEIIEENQTNYERVQTEKDMWEQKFEQKRKALKEIEQQFNRENSELEKKLCLLQEKFTRLDQDKRKQEQDFQERIHDYEAQIQNLDSSAGEAFYYGNAQAEQMMQLKTQQQELERQLSDLQSTYDKDKALWEGKCTFLENQKESYKKDLIESQRKFEITLEQLQKRGNHVHDKYEQNQNAIVKVIENKYKAQIKEMLESHQCLQNEIQNKCKRIEEESKRLKEQNAIIKRESEVERQQLEFRIQELQKLEISLKNDISELRNEKEKKLNQYQQQAQKDREIYKQRITDAEKKAKEADQKRTQMIFDIEKEKAKWQMEYDSLLSQKRDQDDIIQNLERRKDMIFKENERLKAEWKNNRNSVERSSIGSGSIINSNKLGLGLVVNNNGGNITTTSKNLNLTKINLQNPSMMRQTSNLGLQSNLNNVKKNLNSTGQQQQSLRGSQQNLPPQPKLQINNNQVQQFPVQQMQGNTRYNIYKTGSSDNNSADKTPQILIENQQLQGFTQNINVKGLEIEQMDMDNNPVPEQLQNNYMPQQQMLIQKNYQNDDNHNRQTNLKLGIHNFNQNIHIKSHQSSSQKQKFVVGNSQSSINLGSMRLGTDSQQQNQLGNTLNFENQQQFGLSGKTMGSNSNSAYNQKTASRYSNKSGLD